MSVFSISLGKGKTGVVLKAQKTDSSGVNVDAEITTGFTEIGNGHYVWNYPLSNTFEGCVKFIDSSNDEILAFSSVNPNKLSNGGLDNVEIETNINLKQAMQLISSVLAGTLEINGNTNSFKALNNPSVTRVESETTSSGQRTSVSINL